MRIVRGALCLAVLLLPSSAIAQSFCEEVTEEPLVNPTVLGNGTPGSVTTAQIQAALDAGGHIRFNLGAGVHTINLTATLVINRPVVIDGSSIITLSGGGTRRILRITNTNNVAYSITLQNLGFAHGNTPSGRGAAIFKDTGGPWQAVSLKIYNCAFNDNHAMLAGQDDGGGALYATGMDHVRIKFSTFTSNRGSNGGAVYSLGSRRVTIVNSWFIANQATGTGGNPGNGGNAGAVGIDGADRLVDVCRTRFIDNTSNAYGAGFFSVMYDSTSRSRFEDVLFQGNRQLSSGQHTGGAYIQDGPFAMERVTFLRNEAQGFGGLFVTGSRAVGTIRNATFEGNVARTGLGAAMAIGSTSPVSIVNTTIARNVSTAAFAAGISVGSPNQLRLTNVLLADNTGGNAFVSWGINNPAAFDGGGNMQWPPTRPNGGAEVPSTPSTVFANPLLAAVAENGGFLPTIAIPTSSPARDTGVTTPEVPPADARGMPRLGPPEVGSFELGNPSIRVFDDGRIEGNSGTTLFSFTFNLSLPSHTTVTVNYATANGTAGAGDYQPTSGTVTVPVGWIAGSFTVTAFGDTVYEADETFFVNLSAPTNATIDDGQGVGTILNDDLPSLTINDVSLPEGDAGAANAVFTVTLSPASNQVVSVNYAAVAGTATAGVDFGTVAGTVTFPAGTTTQTVLVPVVGDTINEPSETFFVNLSGPSNATLGDGQGQGTIQDDDAAGLTISDVAVRERITPTTTLATFTVTLAPTSGGMVTVNWATADGTATAGSDYVAGSGPLTFNPGQATQTINVTVNADALVEGMETFVVSLSGAIGATIAHGTGTASVLDPPAGGDFNADNRNDLLWRHDVSGENVLWFMNGATLLSGTFTTPPTLTDVRWKMVGTNDFNADGKPDILWRHNTSGENVLWYMNGSVLTSGTFLTPSALVDTRWGMSGTGDFNLDGKPDILWRHSQSGEIVVWFMNGSVLTAGTFLTPPAFTDVNWQTVGTGDFNSDGKTDILWRHAVSGQNVVWFLEGTSLVSGAFTNPPTLADTGWKMVATSDYNFDGKVDIVWRHSTSGQNVIWFMDGINLIGGTFTNPQSLPDNDWKIVGPR